MNSAGDTLIVDWLGRGGIAQTTEAWRTELAGHGVPVTVATRGGRELDAAGPADGRGGPIVAHWRLVRRAVSLIERRRPRTVVIQNYLLPPLEWPVFEAAVQVGARIILVIHDDRLHSLRAGTRAGLRRSLRRADVVVAHSDFVGDRVERFARRHDVVRLPLPGPVALLRDHTPEPPHPPPEGPLTALHYGILRRGYKGTDTVMALAQRGVPGWRFRLVGTGAPLASPHVSVIPGYVSSATLLEEVERSDATVLPYRFATQSGAVPLSQALSSVVVSTSVGGIPEQVEHGTTGLLLAPEAPVDAWRDALSQLSDPSIRAAMATAARARVWANHDRFAAAVGELTRAAPD